MKEQIEAYKLGFEVICFILFVLMILPMLFIIIEFGSFEWKISGSLFGKDIIEKLKEYEDKMKQMRMG